MSPFTGPPSVASLLTLQTYERTDYVGHLVAVDDMLTPGPALCGLDRFAGDVTAWNLGGGDDGPDMPHHPCGGCVEAARNGFPGAPMQGLVGLVAALQDAIGSGGVVAAVDAVNARLGWSGGRLAPVPGHMVREWRSVDGIDVARLHTCQAEFRIAGMLVGVADDYRGIGIAGVRCLIPHRRPAFEPQYQTGLHEGGAWNAFQAHLLTAHGSHHEGCASLRRADRCPLCGGQTRQEER